jgi:hypothetical protein
MREDLAALIKQRGSLPHESNASAGSTHAFSDEFVPDIVSAMFVESIIWWLEQGKSYTPERLPLVAPCLPLRTLRKQAPGNDRVP